jgi:uncharacterized CHY-type Zn-finger protein
MTSTRIEAARQSQTAHFRPAVTCGQCHRNLSIAEQIERFCDRCSTSPKCEAQGEVRS